VKTAGDKKPAIFEKSQHSYFFGKAQKALKQATFQPAVAG